ncbi:hypothetical protein [Flavobacterium sp.]|uniref:hypothetical protein n=1 Tax=Flavobacterium sp. TaxID=239 RepID=UPI00391B6673
MNAIVKRKASRKLKTLIAILLAWPMASGAQSDVTALVKGGEILVGGLITIFSSSKKNPASTTVESVCIKNKMTDKITLVLTRQTEDGEEFKKELIIQKDSKECLFELPKGVYSYEVILANNEVYKKGEYLFKDKTVITLKEEVKEEVKEKPVEETKEEETKTPTG